METAYKATASQDEAKLRWLALHLGGRPLAAVDGDLVARVAVIKATEASRSTANRYLALVRAILRRAHEVWQWIERRPRILLFPERVRRVRWLTPDQVRILLRELPEHQRQVVAFALATGLRQANILNLTWHQVDLRRRLLWIPADQAKGRQAIRIPLAAAAMAILERNWDVCRASHPETLVPQGFPGVADRGPPVEFRVFTYRGRPIRWANTRAWRDALRRAGIYDFRWHDLRHTWASWHAQAGTPLYVLQELGGWQSESMVRRYAHLTPSLFAEYAEAITNCLPERF